MEPFYTVLIVQERLGRVSVEGVCDVESFKPVLFGYHSYLLYKFSKVRSIFSQITKQCGIFGSFAIGGI